MTYHTSVYENKLLPPFLKKIVTVCTSTQQLTLDMEDLKCNRNSVILCACVSALYQNMPITFGLQSAHSVFFNLQHFTPTTLNLIMNLLH